MDLAAWAKPASPWEKNCRMNWCVSPAGTCPLPGPSVFSSMFVGYGKWFFLLPHSPLPRSLSLPLSPYRRQRKGKGLGGQGSPSVLRLHRVFRLNQENFYYQKEKRKKKKKKKSQRPPFLPAPLGQSRLDLWGSWEGGSGLEHSQARVVGFPAGPPPGPLWASPLPTAFPSKRPTRGGLPLPPGPWAMGLILGPSGGTAQPWRG